MLAAQLRVILCCIVGLALCAAQAEAQEIWFGPHAPGKFYRGPLDWREIFKSDAPWQTSAAHVKMFDESTGYFDGASDEELAVFAAFLRRHGTGFLLGVQGIDKVPGETCGGMEGYGSAAQVEALAARLAKLNFPVTYIEADEPVWFGHFDPDPKACQLPIDVVAHRVALTIRGFLKYFPDAAVGDIEPVPPLTAMPGWREAMSRYRKLLEAEIGRKLVQENVDVDWSTPSWPRQLAEFAGYVHDSGLKLGIIYNGDGFDRTDEAWMEHARRNFNRVEGELGIIPDVALFASWQVQPEYLLPETSPTAHTNLILSYLRTRTRLVLHASAGSIGGQLLDAQGHGVAGAKLQLQAVGLDTTKPPPVAKISGMVPEKARAAAFALGINRLPAASGDNVVVMGDFTYAESGSGAAKQAISVPEAIARGRAPRPGGIEGAQLFNLAGQRLVRLAVRDGQSFNYLSPRFTVDPGASFTLAGPMASATGEGMFGNIDLLWFDDKGEITWRSPLLIDRTVTDIAETTTDREGRFTLKRPAQAPGAGYRLVYAGSDALRAAYADYK